MSAPPPTREPSPRVTHLRRAAQFGAVFAIVTLGNVLKGRAAAAWWEWLLLPSASFVMFGGLAYGLLRASGRPAPQDGSIPVSSAFAAAVIGAVLLAIGVPVYLFSRTDRAPSDVLLPTGVAMGIWLATVVVVSYVRTRPRH